MADKKKGWIKLYRSLRDNPLWQTPEPFDDRSAWIDLLMMVNHEDRDVKVGRNIIKVKKGQTWTSMQHLAARWHWSRANTYRYTKMLKKLKMITTDATASGTLLTVVNWGFFNGERNTNDTTNDTTGDTTPDTTNDTQTRIIKNIKNEKNEEEKRAPDGAPVRRVRNWQ